MFPNAISLFVVLVLFLLVSTACGQISPPGRSLGVTAKRPSQIAPDVVEVPLIPAVHATERAAPIDPKEKKLVEPDVADLVAFRDVLSKPGYRIVKLLDSKCETGTDRRVVNIADGCLRTIPGDGADFSFRRRDYSIAETADLKIKNGKFVAGSVFIQGLMVSLGTLEIEKIDLHSEGAKYLASFEPATDCDGAKAQTAEINGGIINGRSLISAMTEIKPNQTYVLRSIAYRVNLQVEDKRRDIIVAFKVVRQDEEGNVTLIWKELQNKESPKLKIDK